MDEDAPKITVLPVIIGTAGTFLDNPALSGPAIRPILSVNVLCQDGQMFQLPLTETGRLALLDVLSKYEQALEALQLPKPSKPPRLQ